jgi:hypothetical protein
MRGVALGLGIPLGVFGAHRFYAGKVGTGVLQLLTLGGMGLWWLYDMILISAGEFRDADGRRLAQWSRSSPAPAGAPALPGVLTEDVEMMQGEIRELAERVDFLERMLSQVRDRARLPGSEGS